MTIEINELIIQAQVMDSSSRSGSFFSDKMQPQEQDLLIEKIKQEIVTYLIERELL